MNEETKAIIDELKGIVMDLHRSAGQLDKIIQDIETVDVKDTEFMYMYIGERFKFRQDYKRHMKYCDLEDREYDIWERIYESLKEGAQ